MSRKKIPHFRLYIDDFLSGTKDMSAAVVGDYIRLLCAIYDQDGQLRFDPFALRHVLGCTRAVDVTQRVMRLVVIGKLNLSREGFLSNGRADRELEKRQEFQNENPAAKGAAKGAAKPQVSYPKNPIKTNEAVHPRAQSFPRNNFDMSLLGGRARENGNGSAPASAGALGLEGRAPQPPIAKGGAPPPDRPWPPPSALLDKVYPNGKAAKPGNGTQPGRHRGRPRKTAAPKRAAEDKPGAQKGAEGKGADPRRT
jgi:uncharacterized protein YdaU (DUF1376 family)